MKQVTIYSFSIMMIHTLLMITYLFTYLYNIWFTTTEGFKYITSRWGLHYHKPLPLKLSINPNLPQEYYSNDGDIFILRSLERVKERGTRVFLLRNTRVSFYHRGIFCSLLQNFSLDGNFVKPEPETSEIFTVFI